MAEEERWGGTSGAAHACKLAYARAVPRPSSEVRPAAAPTAAPLSGGLSARPSSPREELPARVPAGRLRGRPLRHPLLARGRGLVGGREGGKRLVQGDEEREAGERGRAEAEPDHHIAPRAYQLARTRSSQGSAIPRLAKGGGAARTRAARKPPVRGGARRKLPRALDH